MLDITRRAALGIAGAGLAAPARAQAPVQLTIATGTTGGVYYPLGGGLANILSRHAPGLSATVEVTGGAVANLQLLSANRVGLILTQVDSAMDAIRGEDRFRGRPVAVRAIAVIYTNRQHVVTTVATGIRRFADLRGKRLSTGAPGSWTEVVALRMLEAGGIDPARDLRARERLSPNESTNAIKDGKLDAYFFIGGLPTGAVTDLAASPGIELRLIDHDELIPRLAERYGPVYQSEVIPAGTYPGQREPNRQLSIVNLLAMREDAPAELVTRILETAWAHRADLALVHPEGRNFTLDRQTGAMVGIPWHPAAAAFWGARGAAVG